MKKAIPYLMAIMLFCAFPHASSANNPTHPTPTPTPKEMPAEVRVMLDRIDEIKEMDKSQLSRAERKELRMEVKEIKKEVRAAGNGIYISAGALIIILLLIIIL